MNFSNLTIHILYIITRSPKNIKLEHQMQYHQAVNHCSVKVELYDVAIAIQGIILGTEREGCQCSHADMISCTRLFGRSFRSI